MPLLVKVLNIARGSLDVSGKGVIVFAVVVIGVFVMVLVLLAVSVMLLLLLFLLSLLPLLSLLFSIQYIFSGEHRIELQDGRVQRVEMSGRVNCL